MSTLTGFRLVAACLALALLTPAREAGAFEADFQPVARKVADAMQGFDIAMVARDVAEIGEVERALRRVADGSYGRCIDCDQPIPPARLNAYPAAARCIRCQEAFERRQG